MQVVNNSSIPTSRSFTFADEDETKDEINQSSAVVTPSKSRSGPVSPTSSDNALSPSSLAYSLDSASPVKKLQTIPTNNAALLQTPPTASHSRVMLTPTKINISPSGMDDVHPLATMNTAATINKTPIQLKEVDDKHPSLFANTVQINKHKISPEMSELTTTPTPKTTIAPQANNGKLNMKQQVAMNNFLKAQTSGNPIAKNEKWKELVYAMKESETDSPTTKQFNNRLTSSTTKSTTGSRYSKGSTTPVATKDYNAILGTLTINTPGGLKIGEQSTDGISLSSGLTSKSDSPPEDYNVEWGSINMWNPSPQPTPKKSASFSGDGKGNQLTYRTVTPPNVPILSKGDDDNLPLVSPLSVDESFDEEENNGLMDTTGETTMSTPEELKLNIEDDDGDKKKQKNKGKKKNAPCFFNLGESFADNTKRIWTDPNDDVGSPNIGSPVSDPSSSGIERRSSSRTLSPLLLPSPRRSESPIVRGATFDTTKEVPSFSLGQPPVVVQQQRSTASASSSVASNSQLVCKSIEGEVMSYQDMEEQSLAAAQKEEEITAVFGDFTTQDDVVASPPPADVLPEREKKAATPSVVASVAIQELSQSIPLTRSEPTLNPPPTTSSKRRTKTTTPSLEEQILSVITQQPESHVVDEEDEVDEDNGETIFGRSSPLPPSTATPSTSTKPKKKKKKSGTVGSTASAQDILKELRSSTPHSQGKYSGSLHSGGYSGTSLNSDSHNFLRGLCGSTPHSLQSGNNNSSSKKKNETVHPLGSISARLAALEARHDIGVGSAEQVATPRDQAANTVSRSPSDEDESADQVGVKLPPSKRDVPRPNRISRRSVSEPTPVATELKPATSHGSSSAATKSRDTSEVKGNTQADTIHPPVQANPEPPATSRISRLFPNTTPKPTITSGGTPPRQSTNPFDDGPSTNPFDSPPRQKVIEKSLEDPFDEQSSPIPIERSGVASEHSFNVDDSMDEPSKPSTSNDSTQAQRAIAPPSSLPPRRDRLRPPLTLSPSRRDTTPSPFRAKTSASPQTTKSSSSSEYIDELRATISQLKRVGVGGHGKPTSTLVRNEQTGRYVIRDISDDNFKVNLTHDDVVNKDDVLPEEISTPGESYIGSIEENSMDESSNVESSRREQQSFEEKPRYNPLTQIIDDEVMDEAAVDAAVQAATMECMSTSSTTSHEASIESVEDQQHTGGDVEEDDFFVVRKPIPQSDNEWSGFASFAKEEDSKDDFDILPSHSWADDKDDDFATGWDDSGFEETMWTPVSVQKKTIPFSSPTSVATSKQTVTF